MNNIYTITYPDIQGYSTPNVTSNKARAGLIRTVEVTYNTENLILTLETDDSESVSGQIVTINNVDYTYSTSPLSVKIPFGEEYTISVNSKDGYEPVTSITHTANTVTRNITITYQRIKASYITINDSISDPNSKVGGEIGKNGTPDNNIIS